MMSPLDEVAAWLRKAQSDLLSARILIEHDNPFVWGPAAFHCQQAAEKALKAFLVWRSRSFERVHSLVYLMDLCEAQEPGFAALREAAESLSPYATEIRYPGESIELTLADAREALVAAEMLCGFVRDHLPIELWREFRIGPTSDEPNARGQHGRDR